MLALVTGVTGIALAFTGCAAPGRSSVSNLRLAGYSATVTGGVGVVYIRAQLDAGTRDDCATFAANYRIESENFAVSAADGDPATLVVTNLDENVPVVWRAAS